MEKNIFVGVYTPNNPSFDMSTAFFQAYLVYVVWTIPKNAILLILLSQILYCVFDTLNYLN